MVYREHLLEHAPKDVQTAFRFLNKHLFIYDSFIFATSENQLDEIDKYETRIQNKLTKSNWIRDVKSNTGMVFIIQHGSKRFKANKTINWAIEQLREQYGSKLNIEIFDKYEKFDVYFIGLKKGKQTETETENANQTI